MEIEALPLLFGYGRKSGVEGALATLCPTDKKLIHGMEEAVLVPVGTKKGPTEGP